MRRYAGVQARLADERAITIEFASFAKEGQDGSVEEAQKHKALNRYADVLPYDESLVRLPRGGVPCVRAAAAARRRRPRAPPSVGWSAPYVRVEE